jgi:general secretion pathway protein K
MALVLVLWVLALLSVIVLEFCFSMRTEVNITRNFKETGQLYYFAHGGIQRAIAELIYRSDPALHQKRTLPGVEESTEMEQEWRIDGRPYPVPFQQGEAEVRVTSESGRINLNNAPDVVLRRVLKYFVEAGEERDVIVDSILDWRDTDDLHRLNGAENDYYRSLTEPYDCKNGPFDAVEELLLVRGITPELFYGKKSKDSEEEGIARVGLRDIFTVFSTVPQLDINAAPVEVLVVFFGIPGSLAKQIVAVREEKTFANLNELVQRAPEIVPFIQEVGPYIIFQSTTPYFSISSVAKMKTGEAKRGVECIVKIDMGEKSRYRMVMWKDVLF